MFRTQAFSRWTWILIPLLLATTFWPAVTMQGVFYFGDIWRHFYPLRVAYAEALSEGHLPLWTSDLVAGYPLLAEGQVGALYPPNLLACGLLPPDIALNVSILAHFLLAGLGMYLFCRSLSLHRGPSLLGGLVSMLGGFLVAHLNHVSIVSVAAWLPYLLLVTRRIVGLHPTGRTGARTQGGRIKHSGWTAVLALLVAMQFLGGHPQISLLNTLFLVAYAAYESRRRLVTAARLTGSEQVTRMAPLRLVWPVAVAILAGVAMAAAQLLPSYELTALSQRAGGLDEEFFTSFSLHPLYLATLLVPFARGNPYPGTSVELIAYVGIMPLALAVAAPFLKRWNPAREDHPTGFWGIMALAALFLAFGKWNPLYRYLASVPVLNLFRVPARFLHVSAFACSILAAIGLERLAALTEGENPRSTGTYLIAGACLLVSAGTMILIDRVTSVDDLVRLWRYLPVLFALLTALVLILGLQRRLPRPLLLILALLLTTIDLHAFNAVYGETYNDTMPRQEFLRVPQVPDYLPQEEAPYRVYTHEEIVPVLPVMRESLYPNLPLLYGVQSANGYLPLFPSRYRAYVEDLTPRRLNLLNVRYFIIPQLLPVDESSEFYDLEDPFAPTLVGRTVIVPPTPVASIVVESYMGHSVDIPEGEVVADIHLIDTEGNTTTLPLRAGFETSEWAYERSDVLESVRHGKAPIVRTWPAWSGFPPEPHSGHAYVARYSLDERPVGGGHSGQKPEFPRIEEIRIEPRVPVAYLRVERLLLEKEDGQTILLSQLTGEGDHTLAYRSQDAAIYQVHDSLPRAWLVHRAQVIPSDQEILATLDRDEFDPLREVLLSEGEPLTHAGDEGDDHVAIREYTDQRVVIETRSGAPAYLVLADVFYPGWEVCIKNQPGQADTKPQKSIIRRANYLFRAVALAPGEHVVEFRYQPRSFRVGALISLVAFALVAGIPLRGALRRKTRGDA